MHTVMFENIIFLRNDCKTINGFPHKSQSGLTRKIYLTALKQKKEA